MKTSAVIFQQRDEVGFSTIEMPPPQPQEVQIRTSFSTISSGTEGWALQALFTWQETPFPCVSGYQRTGVITAMGSDVTGWRVGDRVMATIGSWTGPVKPSWGSHAAVANTHRDQLFRIPDGVDDIDASATVVAQVGYNAAYRSTMERGDWVLVYGDGIIGQCAAQAARARGAKVIIVGHRDERLKLAQEFSADAIINNKRDNVAECARKICGRPHVNIVIDTVQSEEAQTEYQPLLEYARGQVVYSGFTPGKTWADMARLQQSELTTHFIAGWTRPRMEATLELMRTGQMRVRPLVTHLVSADRGPDMFRMIRNKTEPFMAITLDWRETV